MSDFVSWDMFGTLSAAVAVTVTLTQLLKNLISQYVDPKWYAIGIGMLCMVGYTVFSQGDASAEGILMAIVNGLIVAGASVGLFEGVIKPVERRVNADQDQSDVEAQQSAFYYEGSQEEPAAAEDTSAPQQDADIDEG